MGLKGGAGGAFSARFNVLRVHDSDLWRPHAKMVKPPFGYAC
jgi:hypothetical protein